MARNSQTRREMGRLAPVIRGEDRRSEAWIDYEEGSTDTRSVYESAAALDAGLVFKRHGEGLLPVSGNLVWTSVSRVATLTLCAAC